VDLLLWITIGFIIIGFIVLLSMKTSMENKLASISANSEDEESPRKAKSIIWWIASTTAWGIVCMILIVWYFHNHFG
jgi:Na+/proline symporter